jgi:hypothetical protein
MKVMNTNGADETTCHSVSRYLRKSIASSAETFKMGHGRLRRLALASGSVLLSSAI